MADWSRDTATLVMTSPLGDDVLIPLAVTASEMISQPYEFIVDAVSQQGEVKPDDVLNQPVTVTLQSDGEAVRHFSGIVRQVTAEGTVRSAGDVEEFRLYRLIVVPRLWFLNQTTDCRVYQNMTADAIIKKVFEDDSLTTMDVKPSGPSRIYTVQFNETDLQFVTRLMEEEGWYYYFEHTDSDHKLVIANENGAFTDIDNGTLHIGGGDEGTLLLEFSRPSATVRGKMTLKDYDPEKADTLLQSEQPTVLQTGGAAQRDDFRWPALSFDNGVITNRAKWDQEAAEALADLYSGSTRFGGLVPGGVFKIKSLPASPYDGDYVVRSTEHHASDDTWLSQNGTANYMVHFGSFKKATTWRQPIVTPRPRMVGVHTGLVMGPQHSKAADIKSQSGEEIHTDDLGRVKVRFYWDHRAEATGNDSMWARVIQPWAGKGWGAQFIPRVGTEVAVAFVDGDPDRPIVIGGLYNSRDTPIYSKADKNKLGFRTRSVPKGAQGTHFNEFTFDDTKGSELIFFHAEKDYTTEVEHDQTLKVDNCRIVTVKVDETVSIGNNQTIKVKMDHKFTVTDGNRTVTVDKGDNKFKVSMGDHSEEVSMGNYDTKVSMGNVSLKIDMGNYDTKLGMGNQSTDLGMGNYTLKADLGSVTIEAMQGITLKVGQSSVKIDQMGVTIEGMMVKATGQIMTQVKGLMTQVNADAILMVKGGITMIN